MDGSLNSDMNGSVDMGVESLASDKLSDFKHLSETCVPSDNDVIDIGVVLSWASFTTMFYVWIPVGKGKKAIDATSPTI